MVVRAGLPDGSVLKNPPMQETKGSICGSGRSHIQWDN